VRWPGIAGQRAACVEQSLSTAHAAVVRCRRPLTLAVSAWSPVVTTTLMDASRQACTAGGISVRAGSSRPTKPMNSSSDCRPTSAMGARAVRTRDENTYHRYCTRAYQGKVEVDDIKGKAGGELGDRQHALRQAVHALAVCGEQVHGGDAPFAQLVVQRPHLAVQNDRRAVVEDGRRRRAHEHQVADDAGVVRELVHAELVAVFGAPEALRALGVLFAQPRHVNGRLGKPKQRGVRWVAHHVPLVRGDVFLVVAWRPRGWWVPARSVARTRSATLRGQPPRLTRRGTHQTWHGCTARPRGSECSWSVSRGSGPACPATLGRTCGTR